MAFEGMEVDEEAEENMSELDGIDLLWKAVVKPDEPLVAGGSGKYFLRITNASLGPDAQKDTRTCLMVIQASDDDSEPQGVVCTLKNTCENHQLDLLVSDDVQFKVEGKNPSSIYLIGHLSPAEQHVADDIDMNDDDEPTEEELEDLDNETRKQLLQQLGRKRRFAEIEDENPEEENEEAPTAAQKKQKIASGKGKATNNNQNQGKNKNNKNDNTNDKSKSANQQKKKQQDKDTKENPKGGKNEEGEKPWKNGPAGLKFRDIRVGDGKLVKKGSKARVYYVGQLDDKTIFDKQISGEGFEFTVGAGEVIKGWDMGINGMKVGGKRKIVIPSKLAYGEEGSPPDIPPNSQLTFTIELKGST